MKTTVNYLMSYPDHLPYLIVSLYTLRKFYSGEIEVYAFPESQNLVRIIAKDNRLGITPVNWKPAQFVKNKTQLLERFRVMSQPGPDVRLYLDADTTIHDNIDELFQAAYEQGLAMTQFANITTQQSRLNHRLKKLRRFQKINREFTYKAIDEPHPAINGGVWSTQPDCPARAVWEEYATIAKHTNIPDEITAHVVMLEFPQYVRVLGLEYNASVKYWRGTSAKIWHYHSQCHCRPIPLYRFAKRWWSIYDECLYLNLGSVGDWRVHINNFWLKRAEHLSSYIQGTGEIRCPRRSNK